MIILELEKNGAAEIASLLPGDILAGVDGVPCFVLGGVLAVQGAQPPEYLAQAIDRAAREYANRQAAE